MPIKLAMLSEKRGLMWLIIGFLDLFLVTIYRRKWNTEMLGLQRSRHKRIEQEIRDDITPRHFGELLSFKNKGEKLIPV